MIFNDYQDIWKAEKEREAELKRFDEMIDEVMSDGRNEDEEGKGSILCKTGLGLKDTTNVASS